MKLAEGVVKGVITIIKKRYNERELYKPLNDLEFDSLDVVDLTFKIEDRIWERGYKSFSIPPDKDFTEFTTQEIIKYVAEEVKKSEKSESN